MKSILDDRWPTVVRAGAFFVAGAVGAELLWRTTTLTSTIRLEESGRLPLAASAGLAVVLVVSPLWWATIRNDRTGPAWGALVGASVPLVLTASLALVTVALGIEPPDETFYNAALFQLLQLPVTVVLGVTGGLLETNWVRGERG